MRSDKNKATNLRKSGKSYQQIERELSIPRSTLSAWFGGADWSKKIQSELESIARLEHTTRIENLNKIRGKHLQKLYLKAQNEATEDFNVLKYHPLFVAGIMLYWGEGDKASPHRISLTNTDPNMVKIFVSFIREFCKIDEKRIKVWLLLYPNLDEATCKKYWITQAGLENIDFNKSMVIQGRHATKRLGHGVCTVVLSSRYFKEKMLIWIKLFPDVLIDSEYYK